MAAMAAGRWMGQADCRGPEREAAEGQSSGPQHPDLSWVDCNALPAREGTWVRTGGIPLGPWAGVREPGWRWRSVQQGRHRDPVLRFQVMLTPLMPLGERR